MTTIIRTGTLALLLALVTACATTESTSRFHVDEDVSYSSFLVIGQAGNYNSRSEFERLIVSELRERGASAAAYHVAVGGDVPISRDSIRDAVQSGEFEAVVLTRALSGGTDAHLRTGATDTLATRRDNGLLDLFRYDYREVTDPTALDLEVSVTIVVEVYDMKGEALVWSSKVSTPEVETIAELLSEAATAVIDRLEHDNLIGN